MSGAVDWRVLFHPLFRERYEALRIAARKIGSRVPKEEARQHPTVKLLAAVNQLLTQTIPADPNAPDFRLVGDLRKFRRAHGYGLPARYRLFWIFSSARHVVIALYLNDVDTLRQSGSSTDPYAAFARLIERGEIGADFAANWEIVEAEQKRG